MKHWRQKDLSPYFPLYFSFRPLMNRQAKYVEQLLLDEHDFDLNKFEKKKGQPPLFFCRDVANDA